jgi:hypothetical protein
MADRGPLPTEVQKKKISVEIRRLEHQIEHQELEVMELYSTIQSREENIESSKVAIEKQRELLLNLDGPSQDSELDG